MEIRKAAKKLRNGSGKIKESVRLGINHEGRKKER